MKSVLLTTGGTGGHIFPALAVAEEIRRQYPDLRLQFVGSLYGPEKSLMQKNGIPFEGLAVRGFLGRGWRAVSAGAMMTAAIVRAVGIIRRRRPQVVLGFGGYAALAPMLAATLMGVPCVLHEQNAIAGASNRLLGKFARRICLSWPETSGFAQAKCVLTGNPVRTGIHTAGSERGERRTRRLLVLGGSQGAQALNDFLPKILPHLAKAGVEVRHQSGERGEAPTRLAYAAAGCSPDCVSAFIDNMAEAYRWADIAICRAGASTAAELCAAGLPAVLVPFPHAAHDHQAHNARILEKAGVAVLLPESELHPDHAGGLLLDLLKDKERLNRMSLAALKSARPDAAARVLDVLKETADAGNSKEYHET
ncbi:MAG: undecaprenyldiphospho-muramoylpentapeptide beta-N-acetylglucosaminyltransferase [Desulfovibrio sp.]|jgi:UDP-N-acetylglucosamine--N-acetylmuramyl-(pentapeptide) pyrophosphoryl-undecaprenol N-acetylglucosamine transferase|nr:undecaprenyldiphospho-muramoylpentapeptide beta-N-acetylglucosaminyltransferase [Desulfovibrio sp.]